MVTIRVGVSPWRPAVDPCIMEQPMKYSCRKHLGIELEPLIELLKSNIVPQPTILFTVTDIRGCGNVTLHQNGTISGQGLLFMLLNDTIDITGNACRIDRARADSFIAFSSPIALSEQVLVTKKEPPFVKSNSEVFTPFTTGVWLCLISVFISYWLIAAVARAEWRKLHGLAHVLYNLLALASFDSPVGSIRHKPKAKGRLAVQVWVWTTKAMALLYVIKITAVCVFESVTLLDSPSINHTIDSIESGTSQLIIRTESYPEINNPYLQQKFLRGIQKFPPKKVPDDNKTVYDMIHNSSTSNYVHLRADVWIQYDLVTYAERDKLNVLINRATGPIFYGYAWNKNHPYHDNFSRALLEGFEFAKTVESRYLGVNSLKMASANKDKVSVKKDGKRQAIALANITGLLIPFMSFLGLSICILVAEYFINLPRA